MTIRSVILMSFLAVVLGTILLGGALSFFELRHSLEGEIAANLRASAAALVGRMDAFVAERVEDLREWRRLEIFEDIRVDDLDKRLARLLSDLKAGHGQVYRALYCTDPGGRVVAASDNALVGTSRPPAGYEIDLSRAGSPAVLLERPARLGLGTADRLVLRTEIRSDLSRAVLGALYAEVSGAEIRGLLAQGLSAAGRTAILADSDGRAIAAAGDLADSPALPGLDLSPWLARARGTRTMDAGPLGPERLLVGTAASPASAGPGGVRWQILVAEPARSAFAPVRRLARALFFVALATLALAVWLAVWLSARIAKPIGELTAFARGLDLARVPTPPRIQTGIAEVGELSRAFVEMLDALGRSREQLIRAGKLAVVGEMAAIMAHEVRTPLGILKSSAQLLERRADLSPQDRELTAFIGSETERLNRLVTTLLDCASPRPPTPLPQDLHTIVTHVLGLVGVKAEKRSLTLDLDPGATDPVLACDREQIVQVLLNLVVNAIQHLPEGGRVRLATEDAGDRIRLLVEDDGPGIPEDALERVFDPFFTRREGGVGLGLTVVRQIVEAHGGTVTASRGRLGGACFNILLPRSPGAHSP